MHFPTNNHPLPKLLGNRYRIKSIDCYEAGATLCRAHDLRTRRDVLLAISEDEHALLNVDAPRSRIGIQRHPGLANILDTSKPSDYPHYLVLEVPEGRTLASIVAKRGRYAVGDFCGIGCQILLAISHLHELGLVHRNLHADNVYILGEDPKTARVKIAGVHTCVRDRMSSDATRLITSMELEYNDRQRGRSDYPDSSDDVFELGLMFKNVVDLPYSSYSNASPAGRRLLELCDRCTSLKKEARPGNARRMLEEFTDCFPPAARATRPAYPLRERPQRSHRVVDEPLPPAPLPDLTRREVRPPARPRFRWLAPIGAAVVAAAFVVLAPPRAPTLADGRGRRTGGEQWRERARGRTASRVRRSSRKNRPRLQLRARPRRAAVAGSRSGGRRPCPLRPRGARILRFVCRRRPRCGCRRGARSSRRRRRRDQRRRSRSQGQETAQAPTPSTCPSQEASASQGSNQSFPRSKAMIGSILLSTLLGAAAPEPASSAPANRNDAVAAAVAAYAEGDHKRALEAFEHAYRLEHRPVDLYNIGRIYEELGKPERARGYYKRFLNKPGLTDEERTKGQERLAALPQPKRSPATAPPPDRDRGDDVKHGKRRRRGADDKKIRRAHWATITGAVLTPIGVASLATGTALALTAIRNARNAETEADEQTPADSTPHYALARRQAIAADALLVSGVIVTATGIIMVAVGVDAQRRHKSKKRRRDRRRARVSAGPTGPGFHVSVQF